MQHKKCFHFSIHLFSWCQLLHVFLDHRRPNPLLLWSHSSQETCSVTPAGVLRWGGVVRGVDRHRLSVRLPSPGRAPGQHASPLGRSTHEHAARCGEETVASPLDRTRCSPKLIQQRRMKTNLVCRKNEVLLWGGRGQISITDIVMVSWELLWDRQTEENNVLRTKTQMKTKDVATIKLESKLN